MQSERFSDPYLWTWEGPAIVITLVLVGPVAIAQFGRSLANLMATGHWYWPSNLFNSVVSLPAIVAGDGSAGLAPVPPSAAPAWLVIVTIVVMELATIFGIVFAAVAINAKWGKGAVRGLASDSETEEVLGVSRLGRNAAVIRPDLDAANDVGHDGYHPQF